MSHPLIATNSLSKLKNNSSFTSIRRPRPGGLVAAGARRAGALLLLLVLSAVVAANFHGGSTSAAAPSPRDKASADARLQRAARRPETGARAGSLLPLLSPATFQLAVVDALDTYAADCVTPKTDFNLGETVCVRTRFPSTFLSLRHLTFIDPGNHILDAAFASTSGQTNLFTLPGSATSMVGEDSVDNRGTWRVDLRSADGSRSATASFDVHEPANPRADLQISVGAIERTIDSGASVSLKVVVYNAGPDAATNVQVSALSASGLSLQSFTGATAGGDCGTGGVCTHASLPRGEHALFVATYDVTASAGSRVSAQASVMSDTGDPQPSSNSDAFSLSVSQVSNETQNCTLTPPQPITVDGSTLPDPNDPSETLYGAVVTYAVDGEGDSCSPIQCDTPSGSLFPAGTTLVTCTAASGDSAIFPVTVVDTRAFQINLIGANPLIVECNGVPPFADPGATTNRPGITPTASGNVNPNVPGTYTITYTATDGTNTATATRTVNVRDDAPPQITLNGDNPLTDEVETQELTLECHTGFTDAGATANDACAGSVPVNVNGSVDPNTVGTYTLTYSATDEQGTPGDPSDDLVATITRTIHVVDTTAPSITLTGGNVSAAECHLAFTDPGATATDNCAGDLDSAIQVSGVVDSNTVGTYTLTYTVSDASGNTATAQRTVNVVDTTPPAISINGANPATVECHASYTDAGATASDACGGSFPVSVSGSVDVNTPGAYTITYTASDGTNTGTATRTVYVVDTTAPVISCPANIVVSLPANTSAVSVPVSFNPTASDSCGTAAVTTSHASGANFPVGTTTVTATATDQAGNTSSCSFNVTVRYLFAGFFSPISNLPVLNTVKAGSAIPIKFSLSGSKGLNIFAADSPASGIAGCNSTDPAVDLTEIDTPGASLLTYDAASDRYGYTWKTLKAWEGTCRQLVVTLNDGTQHRANFKFK